MNVELKRGHPVVGIPLPTSNETCEFTLYDSHSVKSFIESIKEEDEGITDAQIHSSDGNRVAQMTRLSALVTEGFQLKINNELHTVHPSNEGIIYNTDNILGWLWKVTTLITYNSLSTQLNTSC